MRLLNELKKRIFKQTKDPIKMEYGGVVFGIEASSNQTIASCGFTFSKESGASFKDRLDKVLLYIDDCMFCETYMDSEKLKFNIVFFKRDEVENSLSAAKVILDSDEMRSSNLWDRHSDEIINSLQNKIRVGVYQRKSLLELKRKSIRGNEGEAE